MITAPLFAMIALSQNAPLCGERSKSSSNTATAFRLTLREYIHERTINTKPGFCVVHEQCQSLLLKFQLSRMAVGKIFSRGGHQGIFPRWGPEVVKFVFFHSKLRKQHFLLNFQNPGGPMPLLSTLPKPMLSRRSEVGN